MGHAVCVVDDLIFDSTQKYALKLSKESQSSIILINKVPLLDFNSFSKVCDARNHHNGGFHFYDALPKVDDQDLLEFENVVIINKPSDTENIWNLIVIFPKMFRIELINPEPSEQSKDLLYTM